MERSPSNSNTINNNNHNQNVAFGMGTGSGLGMGISSSTSESGDSNDISHTSYNSWGRRPSTSSSILSNSPKTSNGNPISRAFSRRSLSQNTNLIPSKKDANGHSYPPSSSKGISNQTVKIGRNGSVSSNEISSSSPSLNPLPFEEPREDLETSTSTTPSGMGYSNSSLDLCSSGEGIDPFDNSRNHQNHSLYSVSNSSSNSFHNNNGNGSSPSLNSTIFRSAGTIIGGGEDSHHQNQSSDPNSRRPSSSTGIPISLMKPYQSTLISKTHWEITDTALRCLNNALFLNEKSRELFSIKLGGGEAVIDLLRNPLNVTSEILFLAGRLLFFCTLFESKFNRVAVEELGVVGRLVDVSIDDERLFQSIDEMLVYLRI